MDFGICSDLEERPTFPHFNRSGCTATSEEVEASEGLAQQTERKAESAVRVTDQCGGAAGTASLGWAGGIGRYSQIGRRLDFTQLGGRSPSLKRHSAGRRLGPVGQRQLCLSQSRLQCRW